MDVPYRLLFQILDYYIYNLARLIIFHNNFHKYGIELKKEFCPICNKEKGLEKDPEYKEYLRLKNKFEGEI